MRGGPGPPLRAKLEEMLAGLAQDLRHDEAMQARGPHEGRSAGQPAMGAWIDALWDRARAALLRSAGDPRALLDGRLGTTLAGLAGPCKPTSLRQINRFARRSLAGLAVRHGDGIVTLVSDTVKRWDARTVSARIEGAVGRDLQYIRINGTLVGGLVGLGLHAVEGLLL
jgi:uncharacterized membrane-anchored protein YjiN (DUF445 family)